MWSSTLSYGLHIVLLMIENSLLFHCCSNTVLPPQLHIKIKYFRLNIVSCYTCQPEVVVCSRSLMNGNNKERSFQSGRSCCTQSKKTQPLLSWQSVTTNKKVNDRFISSRKHEAHVARHPNNHWLQDYYKCLKHWCFPGSTVYISSWYSIRR